MGNTASTAACDIVTHRVQYLTSTVEESKMSKLPVHLWWFVVLLDMKKELIVGKQRTHNMKKACKCHVTL